MSNGGIRSDLLRIPGHSTGCILGSWGLPKRITSLACACGQRIPCADVRRPCFAPTAHWRNATESVGRRSPVNATGDTHRRHACAYLASAAAVYISCAGFSCRLRTIPRSRP